MLVVCYANCVSLNSSEASVSFFCGRQYEYGKGCAQAEAYLQYIKWAGFTYLSEQYTIGGS